MPSDPRTFAVDCVLRDGGSIHVRAIRPDDKQRLVDHFGRLSARSVYYRFFSAKKMLSDDELRMFTDLDFKSRVALVATLGEADDERIIGVGRYARLDVPPGEPVRAEVAFAVADEHHGRGIASLLLEQLAEIARPDGIEEFEADVLGENNRMLSVFARSGYRVRRTLDSGFFHLTFPTAETEESLGAQERRERAAAAASVSVFLQPRSVAVIGASAEAGSPGATLLRNLHGCGFRGPIYAIHPDRAEIAGFSTHARLDAVGEPIDLAIIAECDIDAAVADCAGAGVRGVVVLPFVGGAPTAAAADAAARRLTQRVRASGMRMVGPHCMGVLNTDPQVSLNATVASFWPPAGNVAMLSQSDPLGLALADRLAEHGIGLAHFVSVGDKADVSSNDLLAYCATDARTGVIALYLENFGNPRKFARLAPEIARAKPIVAVKAGRSIATPGGDDAAVDALFEQAGVIRTDSVAELFGVTSLLSAQPVPAGNRVAVVTNARSLGMLFADTATANGLVLAALGDGASSALREQPPAAGPARNPLDLSASATPEQFERALTALGADAGVDAVVAIAISSAVADGERLAAAIARGSGAVPSEKPVLVVSTLRGTARQTLAEGPRGRLPRFDAAEDAARALAAAARYARWRARPAGTAIELDPFRERALRAVVDRILAGAAEARWVSPRDAAMLLRVAGIDVVAGEESAPDDALAAAERLGYPLVAKAVAPGLVHRRDRGGIQLDLHSAAAVTAAVASLRTAVPELTSVLLQRQVGDAIEATVGVVSDPTFGPLVTCGLGGVYTELLHDVSYRLPPVTDVDGGDMIAGLRLAPLLDGYRGAPRGDRAALIDLICRVSSLVDIVPELRDMALDPVLVLPPGSGAVVIDATIRLAPL